jgi:hypothetical protein
MNISILSGTTAQANQVAICGGTVFSLALLFLEGDFLLNKS